MQFKVHSYLLNIWGFNKLRQISTIPGINATIHAFFYNENGNDMARIENTEPATQGNVSLCSFKQEGDQSTVIKDLTSYLGPGINFITLPDLKENKYYFIRQTSSTNNNYSNSYIKKNGNWELTSADVPIITSDKGQSNTKKRLQKRIKKKAKDSPDNHESDTNNGGINYNWIIWTCVTVLVVLLIGLGMSVIFCR